MPVTAPPGRGSRSAFREFARRWRAGEDLDRVHGPERDVPPARFAQDPDLRRRYWRRFTAWLWGARWALGFQLGLGLAVAGLDAAWPVLTGWILDVASPGTGKPLPALLTHWPQGTTLIALIVGGLLLVLATQILGLMRNQHNMTLTSGLANRLRQQLFQHALRLPLLRLQNHKAGSMVTRLTGDVGSAAGLINGAVIRPTEALLRLGVILVVLFAIEWRLTLITLILLVGVAILYHRWVIGIRPIYRIIRKQRSDIDARLTEVFGGIPVVRAFARERTEDLRYLQANHTVLRIDRWTTWRMYLFGFTWHLLTPVVALAIFGGGGYLVIKGQLRIGEVVTLQILAMQVLNPIQTLINTMTETQRDLAALDRVYELLDQPQELPDRPQAVTPARRSEDLAFEKVWFAYDGQTKRPDGQEPKWVLREIDFALPAGKTLALVGRSGAGKTTLTGLVARFFDPDRGTVRYGGRDLRDYRLAGYRSLLGMVSQEVFLFDGTIGENIAYGRRDATRAEIEAAARAANAWEFIARLEHGLDTLVGERGVKLSGGQRQRLSIARAILADPAIVILDEATSNLETESERLIQASFANLLAGRTTVLIAHRLSTVRHADLILVLDHGAVIERGNHDALMAKGPGNPYFDMVERQAHRPGEADPLLA